MPFSCRNIECFSTKCLDFLPPDFVYLDIFTHNLDYAIVYVVNTYEKEALNDESG